MRYKDSKKIIVDKRKAEALIRLGCPKLVIFSSIMGEPTKTGDTLLDEILESLAEEKTFYNWGGNRNNAGRKPQISARNNQLENQLENQDENQDGGQVGDKDIDYDIREIDKGYGGKEESKESKSIAKFIPPTLDEVKKYAQEQDEMAGVGGFECHPEQVDLFYANYDANGWIKSNGIPIRDWQKEFKKWVMRERNEDARKRRLSNGKQNNC